MDDKLSFVPQKTFEPTFYKKRRLGVLVVFPFFLFLASVLFYGGLLFYKNKIKKETDVLADSLERAKSAFEIPLINEISQISEKINYSKTLLERHTGLISIFDFLQENTLKDVRFKDFKYSISKTEDRGEMPTVVMEGLAKSYSILALQGDIFEKDKNIQNVSFSDLGLSERGTVNFNVKLILNPQMLIYKGEKTE